jgi:uncharacterized protein (DUF1800 family)
MGNPGATLTVAQARHLLRRTGFGAPPDKLAKLIGPPALSRNDAAALLLDFTPARFMPRGRYVENIHNSWIKYMIGTRTPVQEKLVLFWHDHFAASDGKVNDAKLMALQNRLLRTFCKGDFKSMVKAISRDAAMMEFLDTVRNDKLQPNENYARELMELFTLGVKDYSGNVNYVQEDIVQIARAFTGWNYNGRGVAEFDPYGDAHDYTSEFPARGPKVIFKTCGGFGAAGRNYAPLPANEGPQEIDAVVDAIFDHRDSDGKKTVARYIAGKLFTYLSQPYPKRPAQPALKPIVDELLLDSGFDTSWDLAALLRAIIINDQFYATAAPAPFQATDLKSIKWPVDYVVSTLRLLDLKLVSSYQYVNGGTYDAIRDELGNMGQLLFEPPSVFGWDWDTAWVSSATLLARYGFARDIAAARGPGRTRFHPDKLVDITLTDPSAIVDAVTDVLGVTDQFTAAEKAWLVDYLTDEGANPTLDLRDYDVRNRKLNGLFALVLQSHAYQLH